MTARRPVPRTLRARVSLVAAMAVLGILVLAGAGLVLAQRLVLTQILDDTLVAQAGVVADRLRGGEPIGPSDLLDDDVVVEVVGADGRVRTTVPPGAGPLPAAADRSAAPRTVEVDDEAARLVTATVDGAVVRVAGSLEDVEESTAVLVAALAVAVPLAAAALAGVVWWAVGRALRPVERIRERVDTIGGSALDRRVPEPGTPAEIDRLARTMNAMLARLQASAEQQRRFVADASHELRSPLARMRTELEVDAAHPESAEPGVTAASVLAETVGLQRLVEDLLLLARGDAGALAPTRVPLDLDEVVAGAVARARPRAAGIDVDTSGVRPVQVRGDRVQLDRAVGNLLDNALRHARGRVVLTLDEQPAGTARLTVTDDGPGIPAADRERVFQRFTRLDAARSGADGGAGLGLAIARDIAERHGGTLGVADGPGGRLELALPIENGGVSAADLGREPESEHSK